MRTHETRGARGLIRTARKERNSCGGRKSKRERRETTVGEVKPEARPRACSLHSDLVSVFALCFLPRSTFAEYTVVLIHGFFVCFIASHNFSSYIFIIVTSSFHFLSHYSRSSNASLARFSSISRTFSSLLPSFARANNGTAIS